jgi:hypothetical protein
LHHFSYFQNNKLLAKPNDWAWGPMTLGAAIAQSMEAVLLAHVDDVTHADCMNWRGKPLNM